jgi:alkanesulfonate monooxygenase SsuD/methylene tetrahydromethanopterin reductase-like flavin-dependent oxidoreductase (luciferase family)
MPYLYSVRRYGASVEAIRRMAEEDGRDLARFGWYAYVFVNVNADASAARADAAARLGGTYQQDFDAMVDAVAAVGDAAAVYDRLARFVEAGARHIVLNPASSSGDEARIAGELVEQVVPRLRAL